MAIWYQATALSLPLLVGLAGISDLLTMTIPNRISLALVAAFFLAALLLGMPLATLGMHVLSFAVVLAVGFACFALGWIGGGDAKLAAAAALWLGWSHLFAFFLTFSILGGALTLLLVVWRSVPMPLFVHRVAWLDRLHDRRSGVPYGIAIAGAVLILFPSTIWYGFAPA